jgi:hypothetical protein
MLDIDGDKLVDNVGLSVMNLPIRLVDQALIGLLFLGQLTVQFNVWSIHCVVQYSLCLFPSIFISRYMYVCILPSLSLERELGIIGIIECTVTFPQTFACEKKNSSGIRKQEVGFRESEANELLQAITKGVLDPPLW